MRLFLYLLALVVGLSPAQASRVVLNEPVSVGAISQPSAQRAAHSSSAAPAHAHLQQILAPGGALWPVSPASGDLAQISIRLTDRPRA